MFISRWSKLNPLPLGFFKEGEGDGGAGGGAGGGGGGAETWHSKLPDDLKADPSLVDFKDEKEMIPMPINVARSYVNTKKLVGRDKIPMPKTPEEWDETYKRLGRPEAPTHYNVAVEGIEDPKLKEMLGNQLEWFKSAAHSVGLNDAQAQKLFKAYTEKSGETLKNIKQTGENSLREAEVELRTRYGNAFEGKMVLMNRGIEELDSRIGGGLKDLIKGVELSRHPAFIKAMVMVGEMMAPDMGLDKDTGGPAISAESLDEQIRTIQASPAYLKATDPGHQVAVDKVARLMQI